jgi:hypothetical protein
MSATSNNDRQPLRRAVAKPQTSSEGVGVPNAAITAGVTYPGRGSTAVVAVMTMLAVGASPAPAAAADFAGNFRDAVLRAHAGAPCPPLRPEPLADQTAVIVAKSLATYLDHNARVVPVTDPLPILKDLGLNVGKAKLVQGAGKTEDDAITSALIIGVKDLPDCSYSEYGTTVLPNTNRGGYYLTAAVLAGA